MNVLVPSAKPSQGTPAASDPLEGYRPRLGIYDELMTETGTVRPHWAAFMRALRAMGPAGIARAQEGARRQIRENGITYNVYGHAQGMDRPWELDPVPLLIGADEWRRLEVAIVQRARLLNAVLADLYGPQRLLTDGMLPAALVLGNPNFLRPLHRVGVPNDVYLHLAAVDVARAPDGRWWVLSDRTQSPSGAGYALENRVVLSRHLPDLFRDANAHRLAAFFHGLREGLIALTARDNPRIVLLSPGPFNETYFEHAYLARYLGFTLVEGGDLTVRDNRVYLKTLDGLKQVDLIIRRLDSDWCDPLVLRPDSALGVPGMVGAVRAGNVVIANALGSGLVECDALHAFLPGLCRHVLGEELALPGVATWWCGHDDARAHVLANLDSLVVRRTFENRSIAADDGRPMFGAEMDAAVRARLSERMAVRGYDFIGQEVVGLSTAPAWSDGRLQPAPMALRVYVAASRDGFQVMPGGLARLSASPDARAISMQQGSASKDTWVLADGPVSTFSLLRPSDQRVPLRRSGHDLPSRAADNLFWLGRYAERAEGTVRLLRSLMVRLADDAGAGNGNTAALDRLLRVLVEQGQVRSRTARRTTTGGIAAIERDLHMLLFDPDCRFGLIDILGNLRRTASLVRERLSLDAFRTLNALHPGPEWRPRAGRETGDTLNLLNDMIRTLVAFSGMEMENMTRGIGWRFLDMGRRLERASHMATLMRAILVTGDAESGGLLDLMLELADSFMTYRSRYLTTPQLAPVVDLLLIDETNPRSVGFQLTALAEHAEHLPRDETQPVLDRVCRIILARSTQLKLADVYGLCERVDRRGARVNLDAVLGRLIHDLPELSEVVARTYFSHAEPAQPFDYFPRGTVP